MKKKDIAFKIIVSMILIILIILIIAPAINVVSLNRAKKAFEESQKQVAQPEQQEKPAEQNTIEVQTNGTTQNIEINTEEPKK